MIRRWISSCLILRVQVFYFCFSFFFIIIIVSFDLLSLVFSTWDKVSIVRIIAVRASTFPLLSFTPCRNVKKNDACTVWSMGGLHSFTKSTLCHFSCKANQGCSLMTSWRSKGSWELLSSTAVADENLPKVKSRSPAFFLALWCIIWFFPKKVQQQE